MIIVNLDVMMAKRKINYELLIYIINKYIIYNTVLWKSKRFINAFIYTNILSVYEILFKETRLNKK